MDIIAKKRDLILIASLLFISLMILLLADFLNAEEENCVAVIEKNGQVLYQFTLSDLTEPQEIHIDGEVSVTLFLDTQGAGFAQSECPDQICVACGRLTEPGQCAVCLPARVSVRLQGGGTPSADAVTG